MIFNPEGNTFSTGPNLLYGRYRLACALYVSSMHDNRPVVLAAGGGDDQATAEVLDYTVTNAWEEGKHIYLLL